MKKEAKPLKDLNLTSRFLFDEVMEDAETLGCALSIIFGREVPLLLHPETEKELRVSPLLRSEDTTDKAAEETGSEHIKRIHERVRKVRESEKVGVKYMQAWEEKYYEREAGREEGLKEGKEEGFMLARKVLKLYGEGMPPEAITRECDLPEEQVRKLVG